MSLLSVMSSAGAGAGSGAGTDVGRRPDASAGGSGASASGGGSGGVIEVRGVWFAYGADQPWVLEDVWLTVEPGDFVGLIGPNGGGKTTLLRVMLGLSRPRSGRVLVFGESPARVRSRIGYVPQHANMDLSAPANVLDIVLMGRLGRSRWGAWYGRSDRDAAMEALSLTEVDGLCRRPIGALSGGQRQRVLIARALASDAGVLLLDEPTAGVDVHSEHTLVDLLHRLNERLPIVMVSHDVSFVSAHLKRVACLNRTLTVHRADEITHELLGRMYGHEVRMVDHAHECPLHDPGCVHGCRASVVEGSGQGMGMRSGDETEAGGAS